jgi:hypothetical protein
MNTKTVNLMLSSVALGVGLMLMGCSERPQLQPGVMASALSAAGTAQLRFVHASPTTAAVDVYVDSATTPLFSNLAFGQASPYATVASAPFSFVLRAAGSPATSTPLFTASTITPSDGQTITAVAGGQLNATQAKALFRISPFVEGFAPARHDHVRLRLVNLDYSLPALGLDVGDDGTVEENNIAIYQASSPEGVLARVGCSLQVALQKTTPAAARLTAFTLGHDALQGGGGLFVIAAGLDSFTPRDVRGLELLVVDASSHATLIKQNPSLYLLNLIADLPAIDLFIAREGVGQPKAVSALPFAALAAPLQVPPIELGNRFVLDQASAAARPVAGGVYADRTDGLAAGERYLVVASGFAKRGDGEVSVQLYRDGFSTTITANGMFRAIAAAADAPAIDVGHFAPGVGTPFAELAPDFDALAYEASSGESGLLLSSAPVNPGVRQTGTTLSRRYGFGGVTAHAFGVVGGAWAPASSDEQPLTFVMVLAPNSGAWTAVTATPSN